MCLFFICIFSLVNCLFTSLPIFSLDYLCFITIEFWVIYTFWLLVLHEIYDLQIFSLCPQLEFCWSSQGIFQAKLLNFDQLNLLIFPFMDCVFDATSKFLSCLSIIAESYVKFMQLLLIIMKNSLVQFTVLFIFRMLKNPIYYVVCD